MAYVENKGIGKKGQVLFRLYYDGPKKTDGSRNQKKESFSVHPLPEKAGAIIKAADNLKNGINTKTDNLALERFIKKATELAENEARKKEEEINKPTYVEPTGETFKELSDRWLKYRAGTTRKGKRQPKTMLRYEQLLERINSYLGNFEVEKVNIDRVEEFYLWLSEQHKKPVKSNKPTQKEPGLLSTQTQWHHHRCLYSVLEYAVERKLLDSNPCKYVRPSTPEGIDDKKIDPYNKKQTAQIYALIKNEGLKHTALVTIALEIGPRVAELLALDWQDIDFNTRILKIYKTWQYVPGKGCFMKAPKNKSSVRDVMLSESTIFLLRQLKKEQESKADEIGTKWVESGAVFVNWNGERVHAMWATTWWPVWIRKTKLPVKKFHDLRHTCISLLMDAGAQPLEIARMVGHSNADMLWRVYGHPVQKEEFNGAEIMKGIMDGKKPVNKVLRKSGTKSGTFVSKTHLKVLNNS
ncbi:MAG: hypothetical protein APF81_27480 [Desulfosporosinus sp. BRH_c37]|nr:MAG: hypothetical protein APF81_27480 [Desulfosporosinus sp. BRH_c37]